MASTPTRSPAKRHALAHDVESALLLVHHRSGRMSVKVAGLIALTALIWSWVLQAEASQALQEKLRFNKPFFIVCFNHSATVVLLPLVFVYFKLCGSPRDRRDTAWYAIVALLRRHSVLPLERLLSVALFLSIFYCVADYFWYAALANVSVAAGTAIFNCSPLFVYCFSICFLQEHVSLRKIFGVITSFVGVTLVLMYQDAANRLEWSALGDESVVAGLLVVVSAALYAAYEVAFKLVVGVDLTDTATVLILTGLSGLLTIPLWIMGSLALAFSPFDSLYEPLGWPTSSDGLALLVLSGALAVAFNVAMPLSLTWTSPLETSVGCMLTIPLSGVLDKLIHGTRFSYECVVGSTLVMVGFGVLELASTRKSDDDSQPEDEGAFTSKVNYHGAS